MTPYAKMAQTAIAAVSRLAEVYHLHQQVKLSSGEIAASRKMPKPVVAKVLTILSQSGLVQGLPGPGGGYWLARDPGTISFYEVVHLFERQDENDRCPMGPGYCGTGTHCPLHADMVQILEQNTQFLRNCNFARFVGWNPQNGA